MVSVSVVFDRVRKQQRGYHVEQVDEFMARARQQIDAPQDPPAVTASDVRTVAFDLQRGGYDISHIDAALARLEAALSLRERQSVIAAVGDDAWTEQARERARVVLARVRRPEGQRFVRAGAIRYGYSIRDVDALADRIANFLTKGEPLTADDIRDIVFRRRRNGYAEWQVDALLDRVIEIIFAIS